MKQHTPGPWHWEDCDGYYSRLLGPNGEWILDDGSAGGEYGQQIDPHSPDGYLVAAAPDLLAACEAAITVVDSQESQAVWRLLCNAIAIAKRGSNDPN